MADGASDVRAFGVALIVVSSAFAVLSNRVRKFGYRILLEILLSSVPYPSIWVIIEVLDWNDRVFN